MSGTIPSTPGIYSEVSFAYVGPHEVDATFSVPYNNIGGLYVDQVGLMFNTASSPVFTKLSGPDGDPNFSNSGLSVNGTGNEKFNTLFDFPNSFSDRVKFGQSVTYDIKFSDLTLSPSMGNLLKIPDSSGNPYNAATHIAGYNNSAGIASDCSVVVPEPNASVIFSLGFLTVGTWYAIIKRRQGQTQIQ